MSSLVFLFVGCGAPGNPEGEWDQTCLVPPIEHEQSERARRLLEEALETDRGIGISAAVVKDGEVIWSDAVGVAEPGRALGTGARMRIGSISKPITAALALRLARKGVLDIDESVRAYLPELPGAYADVTIRGIATHTSGIRQYDFSSLSDSNNQTHYDTLGAAFERVAPDAIVQPEGEGIVYSSLGYNLLGAVIEHVAGASFANALQTSLFKPLGLADTLTDDVTRKTRCRVRSYTVLFGRWSIPTMNRDNSDLYPSGGLISSATDLALFADNELNAESGPGGERLYTDAHELLDGTLTTRSFGWELKFSDAGELEWIGHGGTINGAYASLRYYPRFKLSVAAIANYDHLFTNQVPKFFPTVREDLPRLWCDSCK